MDFAELVAGGRVVADITVRTGKDNLEYGTFSLAVNQFAGAQETAAFYDCTVGNNVLQGMQKAGVKKGSGIMVSGSQTIRTYKGHDGADRTSISLRVLNWKYIGGRPKNETQPAGAVQSQHQGTGNQNAAMQSTAAGSIQPPVDLQDEDDLPV